MSDDANDRSRMRMFVLTLIHNACSSRISQTLVHSESNATRSKTKAHRKVNRTVNTGRGAKLS